MQNVKVVIDGNRLWQKKLDDDSARSSGVMLVSRPDKKIGRGRATGMVEV